MIRRVFIQSGLALIAAPSLTCFADDRQKRELPTGRVDYINHAFYPDRWKRAEIDTQMVTWEGRRVIFLTTHDQFQKDVMAGFLDGLDKGWQTYEKIVGRTPRAHNMLNNKVTIAAVPDGKLTCGLGCGQVGATGIEVSGFYNHDYKVLTKRVDAIPHVYFYEMGRNFFVFGHRHSVFTTGFAVLMRYVCLDALKLHDPETKLRARIEKAIDTYAESDVAFVDAFTVQGKWESEKADRLVDDKGTSDQPVMYASALLKLRQDYGGDRFLQAFYRQILTCDAVRPVGKKAALYQCAYWLVAASIAARQDLTPLFVNHWRMPLAGETVAALSKIDWKQKDLVAGELIKTIRLSFSLAD